MAAGGKSVAFYQTASEAMELSACEVVFRPILFIADARLGTPGHLRGQQPEKCAGAGRHIRIGGVLLSVQLEAAVDEPEAGRLSSLIMTRNCKRTRFQVAWENPGVLIARWKIDSSRE